MIQAQLFAFITINFNFRKTTMTTLNEKVLQLNQLTKSFASLQNQKNNLQSTILEDIQGMFHNG